MSEIKKPVRLSKVARELNVGISTIVDFLSENGHSVESNPNTKLDGEMYGMLLKEFAADQSAKEAAQSAGLGMREDRETVTIDSHAEEAEAPAEEPAPAVEEPAEAPAPAPVAEEPAAPVAEPEPVKEEEPVKEPVVEDKKEEEAPAAAPAPAEEKVAEDDTIRARPKDGMKVSVVGKIDLDKGKKKEEAPKEEKKAEEPVKKEAPKEEAPKAEAKAPEKKDEPKPEGRKEPETIKAQAQKLTGPRVVGKIELPKAKTKKPVASSSDPDGGKKKRKRKRIKKVDVNNAANQQRGKRKGQNQKGPAKPEVSEAEIQNQIKETLARLSGGGKSKSAKNRREKRQAISQRMEEEALQAEMEKSVLKLTEFVTVSELATMMNVSPTEVISACMSLGIFASINQRLDAETLALIAEEFGFSAEFVSAEVQESIIEEEDNPEAMTGRAPIVTVMGHVDHGKTSLLDYVRKANVIAGEAGGITQHIGAYRVMLEDGREIAFLDTPGHEAFTAMRARGAQVTDLAIIVVAADDNVMPQTKEAINHAQAAGVPMVFAINKIDKPGANPDRIREELANMNILLEDWGGKFQSQEISAKFGTNVPELLDKVLLEAELLELKADAEKRAVGTVIESSLDKGRGYVTTLLVQAGTMKVGDVILAGCYYGRVKAMHNERQQKVDAVGPATPVTILGLNGAPNAGDRFNIMPDEREAKSIATKRLQLQREQGIRTQQTLTLEEIGRRLALGDFQELNIIVKGDVDGSIEALSDSLQKLSTDNIQVNIIHKAVGQITESDVLLATASDAIIVGFQVRPSAGARKLAEQEQVDVRLYSIIYQAIEEVKTAMEGMLSPEIKEEIVGTAEIRETFKISKVGTIAGCYVVEGTIVRNNKCRIIRDGIVVYEGELGSLKRFKDDVKEVKFGYECGLNIDKFNDIKVGDMVESYAEVEVAKKL